MTQRAQVYKCEVCGNIVEVLHKGAGALVCCGRDMALYKENSTDAAQEKHVPVVEPANGGIRVKVGSVPHPMESEHYIEWVEAIDGGKLHRQFLNPGDPPEALLGIEEEQVRARAYCNLHGLWGN